LYKFRVFFLTFVGASGAILQLFDNAIFNGTKLYHFIDGLLVIILEVTTHRTQNVWQVIFHQEYWIVDRLLFDVLAQFQHYLSTCVCVGCMLYVGCVCLFVCLFVGEGNEVKNLCSLSWRHLAKENWTFVMRAELDPCLTVLVTLLSFSWLFSTLLNLILK